VFRIVSDPTLSKSLFEEEELARLRRMHLEHDLELSGKMAVLSQLLAEWHRENFKVLIFSQSTKMLDVIARFLSHLNYSYSRLDGKVETARRAVVIDDFSKNPSRFVFLISTKTGGTGLNLCAANIAVIFDPDWNSSNDAQVIFWFDNSF
jgi:SNF2 family DNA or RNA helicase